MRTAQEECFSSIAAGKERLLISAELREAGRSYGAKGIDIVCQRRGISWREACDLMAIGRLYCDNKPPTITRN